MDDRIIVSLSDVEHVLKRPNMYIGSVEPAKKEEWIIENDKLIKKEITYTEGLLKIINEVIDNAIDEGLRTDWKFSNKISFKIKDDKITIEDNGRGLLVKKNKEGEWMPVLAFTKLKAGSNFSDDNRQTIGTNGIGCSATNVFSKLFEVTTCDGKKKIKITCKDNLSEEKHSLYPAAGEKTGTKVTFIPDYERFGVSNFTKDVEILLKTRLSILSWFYPKCTFSYNGESISIKAKDIASMLPEPSVFVSIDKAYVLIYSTEDTNEFFTYVNGISLKRGGTHVDYITNRVVGDIREKLIKKYKNIKPGDIKNRLGFVVLFKDFPNCQFDSQTKETLTNSEKDITAYLEGSDLVEKLSNKILKEKALIENITDIFRAKEELQEKKALQKMNVKKKDVDSDKYFPPVARSGCKYLMLTEGYSAFSGISPVLGRKGIGYYALKGKILNVNDLSLKKAMENKEISDIVNILGIDLSNPENITDLRYEKIIILTDQDMDGSAIAGLLITFFNKVCPKIIKEKRLCRLNTPLLVGKKKNKIEKFFYDMPEANKLPKDLNYFYYKGLGSWNKDDLNQVIAKEGGMEKMLVPLVPDENSSKSIDSWFGNDTDIRKTFLRGREFHIDKA